MEEANPIEANDSDYDPNKETKKEVRVHAWAAVSTTWEPSGPPGARASILGLPV